MMTWNWPVYIDVKLKVDISRCVKKVPLPLFCSLLFPLDMSGRGHRKLRLCSRKNYERKKFKKRSIPPSICSSLKVSMPFLLLPPQSLTVSLPVSLFHDAPLSTFESLKARVECAGVIPCILSMCIERKHLYVNGGAITNRHSLLDPYNYV